MAQATKVRANRKADPFDAALGPVDPHLTPWQLKKVRPGASMGFGGMVMTAEGAATVNALRKACAERRIPVPNAVMLILRHYLDQQRG